jgi:hypothetical protein
VKLAFINGLRSARYYLRTVRYFKEAVMYSQSWRNMNRVLSAQWVRTCVQDLSTFHLREIDTVLFSHCIFLVGSKIRVQIIYCRPACFDGRLDCSRGFQGFKLKSAVFPLHGKNTYKKSGSIPPLSLSFGPRWSYVASLTTRPFYHLGNNQNRDPNPRPSGL